MFLLWKTFLFGLSVLFSLSFVACTKRHSIAIADVTRTNTLQLESRHGEFVSGITLRLAGRLDGIAFLAVSGGATQELNGLVDWKTNQLLPSSNCVVKYWPRDVKAGKLTLDYFFH